MKKLILAAAAAAAVLAMPIAASAHETGIPGGAKHGFYEGNRIAGPVGAVVGVAVGGVIGGVEGALGVRPYYTEVSMVGRDDRWHRRWHRRHHRHHHWH